MAKILIVEDQKDMVTGLVFNFESQGFEVLVAFDGQEGLLVAEREKPDLIVLDIMLPKKDGFKVCRELRERGFDMPILMLTARREEADKVLGLEIGADDYMTKPFSLLELLARVKALLRRSQQSGAEKDIYRFGAVEIDFQHYCVTKEAIPVELTQREFEMMKMFIKNQGKVITRNQFLNEVWGYDQYPNTRTVDAHIVRLRQKLEQDPESPEFILTAHGFGYKFIG